MKDETFEVFMDFDHNEFRARIWVNAKDIYEAMDKVAKKFPNGFLMKEVTIAYATGSVREGL